MGIKIGIKTHNEAADQPVGAYAKHLLVHPGEQPVAALKSERKTNEYHQQHRFVIITIRD